MTRLLHRIARWLTGHHPATDTRRTPGHPPPRNTDQPQRNT